MTSSKQKEITLLYWRDEGIDLFFYENKKRPRYHPFASSSRTPDCTRRMDGKSVRTNKAGFDKETLYWVVINRFNQNLLLQIGFLD